MTAPAILFAEPMKSPLASLAVHVLSYVTLALAVSRPLAQKPRTYICCVIKLVLTLSISFELNLDVLICRDDWPAWLVKGVDHLQEISEEEEWVALLVSFVELELQLGPNQKVGWPLLQHIKHLFT